MQIDLPNSTVEHFATKEEWLAARRSYGIGSSDVPAILGISRFQSALSLYHEKLGVTKPSAAYEEHARWGHILEGPISQRYAEETGRIVADPNEGGVFTICRRPDRPHMIASVDRFVYDHGYAPFAAKAPRAPGAGVGVLEVKNAHLMMKDEWLGPHNNEPPVEYQVQVQHQLACTGAAWGSIAALIGGSMFVWADVPRDEALIARLIELEDEFMERLRDRRPPLADGSESSRAVLARIYPKDNGKTIALPVDAIEWAYELEGAKEQIAAAKKTADDYENKIKQAIGDATAATLPDGTLFTYKLQKRDAFMSPATEFRVLRRSGVFKKRKAAAAARRS